MSDFKIFIQLLAPFAPHLSEDLNYKLWEKEQKIIKNKVTVSKYKSIHLSDWPKYDATKIDDDTFTLVIQVNGKFRDSIIISKTLSEVDIQALTFERENVKKYIVQDEVLKVVIVPKRLINIVTRIRD